MPYPGQGKRVPASFGVDAEWLIEGQFFFEVGTDGSLTEDRPTLTQSVKTEAGTVHGLDAEVVAWKLGLTGNDLLDLNRRGDITFKLVAPIKSGYPATMFLRAPSKVIQIEIGGIDAGRN